MRIAVEGCAHGELEIIYQAIVEAEKSQSKKVDLLICCGDFQATRNLCDLKCMAVPDKYKDMCSFYKYYSGELVAPVLTIFVGGNHEASNYLQELPYGGWVAPNIYYMGLANSIKVGNLRIAGLSGIYKGHDWLKGHFEKPPYTDHTLRSVYHVRNLEVFRLKQLSGDINVFISHDWPQGITKYGNEEALLKRKPFFRSDVEGNCLGSPANMDLLKKHYPNFWFAAHLHCKFAALVKQEKGSKVTKFLALDKCLPKRKFLQIIDMEHDENFPIKLSYDLEWLTVLFLTNHLLSVKSTMNMLPGEGDCIRWIYTPTEDEKEIVLAKMNSDLEVPQNFIKTVEPYNPQASPRHVENPSLRTNPQTTEFCNRLGIDDPVALLQLLSGIKEDKSNSSISTTDLDSSYIPELDSSASSLEQTLESSSCSLDFTEKSPQSRSSTSMSRLNLSMSPLVLPPAKSNSSQETSQSDLSQKSIEKEPVAEEVPVAPVEPNMKKFKRRNQSIYNSQEED